jgi:hypothetical protein
MSRTDKTAPYRVKMLWVAREHHDHRFGDCNLPEKPTAEREPWGIRYTNCYWDTDWYDPIFRCGCNYCSGDYEWGNRKSRHDAKADIKAGRWDDLRRTGESNHHYC